MSKLSILRYVWVSLKCRLYSSVNQEMGTSAHPMFLSVCVRIMSVLVCSWCICSVDDVRLLQSTNKPPNDV